MMFGLRCRLGFWLHDAGLQAALTQRKGKRWKTIATGEFFEDDMLREEGRETRLRSAFEACLRKLPRLSRRADIKAVLALPDRLAAEDRLRFAAFPKAAKEAEALVAHRMARELAVPPELIVTRHHVQAGEGETTCLSRAIDAALLRDVETAASNTGLRLTGIESWSGFAREQAMRGSATGAVLWSDGREHTLWCWAGGEGFLQSFNSAEAKADAEDILRLCKTHALRENYEPRLSVSADEDLMGALQAQAEVAGIAISTEPDTRLTGGRAARVASWA